MFGDDRAWERLLNDEPISSGRHALHFYHGTLGVSSWLRNGSSCCYDPANYAGYPKTPVFDADCRPAEAFLALCGGGWRPGAYKLGLAGVYAVVPLAIWDCARLLALGLPAATLAAALGTVVAWSPPARHLLESGDLAQIMVALLALFQISLLGNFLTRPTVAGWLGLTVSAAAGWWLHPSLWGVVTVMVLGGWLGALRGSPTARHAGLLLAHLAALAVSYPGWADWFRFWWIRLPNVTWAEYAVTAAGGGAWAALAETTFERIAYAALGISGVGWGLCARVAGRPCPGRGMSAAAAVTLLLAVTTHARSVAPPFAGSHFFVMGFWLAVIPAADCLARLARWFLSPGGRPYVGVAAGGGLFLLVSGVVAKRPTVPEVPNFGPPRLALGLPAEGLSLADTLRAVSTTDARILWEDLPGRADLGWAALLSHQLGRAFVGGFGPNLALEHATVALRNGFLAGRPLAAWSDQELDGYCRRYNVGWVVCSTAAARERFARWPVASTVTASGIPDGWQVFALRRPASYLLKGTARAFEADHRRITLADVAPDHGEVVLSLHYQQGWRARPAWVTVERELDPYDPIPLLRLRLPGPVGRITLTWEGAN